MPRRPAALTRRIFQARSAIDAGLLTDDDIRSTAWQRLFQGIYADARMDITHRHRCAAALAFLVHPEGVVAGRSAATIYGVGLTGPADPVEVLVPRAATTGRHRGVILHRGVLSADDRREVGGISVTSPARTCWDLARWLSPVEAVVLVDRMLARRLVTIDELELLLARRRDEAPPARGVGAFAKVLGLADGGAQSPPESRLRVRLVLAGLPRPLTQFAVLDQRGQFVARVDLALAESRVAIEYDGVWHAGSARQIHEDRRRLNALVALGWTVLHVTADRLRDDFDGLVAEIRTVIRRVR